MPHIQLPNSKFGTRHNAPVALFGPCMLPLGVSISSLGRGCINADDFVNTKYASVCIVVGVCRLSTQFEGIHFRRLAILLGRSGVG